MNRRTDDSPPEDTLPDGRPSRSARKRESEALQELGEQLLDLRAEVFASLDLPAKLNQAIVEARGITARGGRRRQLQFIGKLMRQQDEETLAAIRRALEVQHQQSLTEKRVLHAAESWRERLLRGDDALGEWLAEHPGTDVQQLRSLIRQARKDAQPEAPDGAGRHGKAYRGLFQVIRAQLSGTS